MRRRLPQLLLLCLALRPPSFGQGLQISAVTVAPGEWAVLQIAFDAPVGKEVLALQWDVLVPAGPLDADWERILRLFVPVQDAGKTLHCAIADPAASGRVLHCILFGGQKPIPPGAVASMSLQVRAAAGPGPILIRLQNIMGVDRDVQRISFAPVEASVTVVRK